MPPADASKVDDKAREKKKEAGDSEALSQQIFHHKNPDVAKAGTRPAETDKVPKATVTLEGSILFNAYNEKLQQAGIIPEVATAIPKPNNVQVDAKGHVTEVTLPNGAARSFTYDAKGELATISDSSGSYKRENGAWVNAADGKPAQFDNPAVASNGDLLFTAKDGRIITQSQDGKASVLNPADNSVVSYDGNFRVTNVHYANGQSRSFGYDEKGTLNSITETDGKVLTLRDGKWFGPDNKESAIGSAKVDTYGTLTFNAADGKTVSTGTNGEVSHINADGSVYHVDANNRISDINYPSGKTTKFGYDEQGNLNKVVTTDGKTLSLQDGKWLDEQKQDTGITDMRVQPDGSFWFRHGQTEFINSSKGTQTSFDTASITKAAQDLREAKDDATLWVFSSPDKDRILNILEPMSAAQRQLVQEEYAKQNPGHNLIDDLKEKLSGPDAAKAEALLKRQDGVADNSGQIHQALAKLNELGRPIEGWVDDNRVRVEKEIRDSINTLTADQLRTVEAKYQQDYGRSLMDDLQNNENLSEQSKQALRIYAKGSDQRTDDDTFALARMAVEKHRPDLFNEAFRDASQTARDKFINSGEMSKLDDAFGSADGRIARDYLQRGGVSIATIVDGDTHWYHTNKDDITRAVTNASEQDRKDFKRGEELTEKGVQPPYSAEDQRAYDFYKSVSEALNGAGNEREVDKWKAQLRNNESVIVSLLDSHSDGGWFGIGSGTDKNKELSAVENISEKDWQYLREHPEELNKISSALERFDDSHKEQVMAMLQEKLAAADFAASKQVGHRSLQDRLGDNADNQSNRADALAGMSPAEKQQYASNENGFRDKVNSLLKNDEERALAQRIASTTGDVSPTDRVLIDALKNAEPTVVFRDIEAAFKADPTLKDRLANPQTEDDKKLSQWYHNATHSAVDKAGLGDQYYGEGGSVPGEYDTFDNAIFKDGHLPLDQQLRLTSDKDTKVDLIIHASDADKARLLQENPDAATKAFQDSVLGTDKDKRDVLIYALKQHDAEGNSGYLSAADQFRLYSLDGGNSDGLKQMLAGMTAEQRQDLANEYFTKYHSLITADVIAKIPGDQQWRFRELLSPTDVNVRQIALDAQMANDDHTSSWDQFLKQNWDYTRVAADSSQDNMNKFIAEHASELDKLTPEQRKQFDDAIAGYMQAQKAYIDSKGEFAEAFVDATLTVAAIGGAFFTGGTSLALLGCIGAGGAVYRTAMMASIQGTDFDSSAGNILKQSFEGGAQAMLGFLGPEQFGLTMGLKVGGELAEQTAVHLVKGSTQALFREGAEDVLKAELANLTRQGAIIGDKQIAAIAERVAAEGVDKNVVEQAIRQQLKRDALTGVKNIVMHEGELYAKNMLAAQMGSQGKELLATALGFESPDTLLDRMKGSAISTVAGVTMFHGVFRLASSGEYVKIALGKDGAGNVVAGEGTVIRHADGTLEPVVGKDRLVKLREGDTIYEKPSLRENADGSKEMVAGNITTKYNAEGQVTQIVDSVRKTTSTLEYAENPLTHEPVLEAVTTRLQDGSVDPLRSAFLETGVYYNLKSQAMGTEMSVAADGSITFKGKAQNSEIGQTRFNDQNPNQAIDLIRLNADGSKYVHYLDNASRQTDQFGRMTETVSPEGVRSRFEYEDQSSSLEVTKITRDGNEWSKVDGHWVDKEGKPFAEDITVTTFGGITITRPNDLRTPTRPKEPIESVYIYPDGTPQYTYKSTSAATADRIEPPKSPTTEKIIEERVNSGDLRRQGDGTYVHEDPASNTRTIYDASGEVAAVRNAAGQDVSFTRDADGKLINVEYKRNGVVESTYTKHGDYWLETTIGKADKWYQEVKVDPDGSITKLEYNPGKPSDWTGVKERPDGLLIDVDQVGLERVSSSALDGERLRVKDLIETKLVGDTARQTQFKEWMAKFEENAANRKPPLSKEEIANTYYQLDKLISTDNAILSQADRIKLAEQFIYKTANPHTIGQGQFNTCNVTAEIENRLIQLHPSKALQMVTDVATTGKFITFQGYIVDMTVMNNVMTPFKIGAGNNKFNPSNYSGRDYFDQLFQTTSVETYWQTNRGPNVRATSTVYDLRAGNEFRPGDMRYEFSNEAGPRGTGEVINNYSTNPPTREMTPEHKTMTDPLTGKPGLVLELTPANSPNLSGDQMLSIAHEITGVMDPPHMLARPGNDRAATPVNSVEELSDQLAQMKENGGFPATIFVDSRDPLIKGGLIDGGQGGAHVINVQNVFEKDGKLFVEFTNQWSANNDHLGSKAVPVEALYRAMEYRPAQKADVAKSAWRKYYIPAGLITGGGLAAYKMFEYDIKRQWDSRTGKGGNQPSVLNGENQPRPNIRAYQPGYQDTSDSVEPTDVQGIPGDVPPMSPPQSRIGR